MFKLKFYRNKYLKYKNKYLLKKKINLQYNTQNNDLNSIDLSNTSNISNTSNTLNLNSQIINTTENTNPDTINVQSSETSI